MLRRAFPGVLSHFSRHICWDAVPLSSRRLLPPAMSQVKPIPSSLNFRAGPGRRKEWLGIQERLFSRDPDVNGKVQVIVSEADQPAKQSTAKQSTKEDIKEYQKLVAKGSTAMFDEALIPPEEANVFPRIKTTSLSTKRIVIHDEALANSVTLVMVAFRSFADDQLQSWKRAFEAELPTDQAQWYDVTINESFGAQALSGFIQRLQRGRTDPSLHDYYVAFNDRAREPLEALLPSRNRMFGYVLLLDGQSRVRFRASGMASDDALQVFLNCAKNIVRESASR